MRVTLVHNRSAGNERQGHAHPDPEVILRDAGHDVTVVCTRDRWREVVRRPTDLIAVWGGDGTVKRVISTLIGSPVPIAILPAGTANNVGTALGLLNRDHRDLVAAWPTAPRCRFDVLSANGPFDDILAIEGIGLGLFATTMATLDSRHNLALVHAVDAADRLRLVVEQLGQRLADAPAHPVKVCLDGRDMSASYLMVEACNISMVGPNLRLAPDARPSDGLFDVVLVTEADRATLARFLAKRQKSRRRLTPLPTMRGQHLSIEWTGFDLHLDDKTWPGIGSGFSIERGTIDIRVVPGAVTYLNVGDAIL